MDISKCHLDWPLIHYERGFPYFDGRTLPKSLWRYALYRVLLNMRKKFALWECDAPARDASLLSPPSVEDGPLGGSLLGKIGKDGKVKI